MLRLKKAYLHGQMEGKGYKKILVIRLSSIGDIVLTSPIVRSLRGHFPEAEIHFLTKKAFVPLMQHNPHVDRVIAFEGDLKATIKGLKGEGYDFVLDLHHNIRSGMIRRRLGRPRSVYPKDRLATLLYTKLRIGRLPDRHVVDRYAVALREMGADLDGGGLEFYLPKEARVVAGQLIGRHFTQQPIAMALGGNFATKRWPREHFVELLQRLGRPVILLGGKAEKNDAEWIAGQLKQQVLVAAGEYDLLLSAALMERCAYAVTHDSGFMHIGVALGVRLYTLWGNTVPEFGFAPYRTDKAKILEVKGLGCRPCSKLGYDKCPKGHFKCMVDMKAEFVLEAIERVEGKG